MVATLKGTITEEKGFVLVAALLMVAILTIIGIAATRTSETETLISVNERAYVSEFYNAEGALVDTLENSTTWLTGNMLTTPAAGSFTENVDINSDGTMDAVIEIRCIFDPEEEDVNDPDIDGLSDAANDLPVLSHKSPPPAGSGYSMKHFEVRRYGVTATSATGNTRIQTGVWKAFNISQ
jgi:hypothetical protein